MTSIEVDSNPASLDVAGRPERVQKSSGFTRSKNFMKKIVRILEDDRLEDVEQELNEQNSNQVGEHLCLKKVLNITFITTGIVLFVSVVIVIIYTAVGKYANYPCKALIRMDCFVERLISYICNQLAHNQY